MVYKNDALVHFAQSLLSLWLYSDMKHQIILLYLGLIIKECLINGQAIINDQCQSQTSAEDLLVKLRQLENEYTSLKQQYLYSESRLAEVEGRQKELQDKVQEINDQGFGTGNLRNETSG